MMKERSSQVNYRKGRNPLSIYHINIRMTTDADEDGVQINRKASGRHKKESIRYDKVCGKDTFPSKLYTLTDNLEVQF